MAKNHPSQCDKKSANNRDCGIHNSDFLVFTPLHPCPARKPHNDTSHDYPLSLDQTFGLGEVCWKPLIPAIPTSAQIDSTLV